jgi:hypothetical protein
MLLHEFAIEPEALSNWQDFRFFIDQCGVHHGRLISRFPKKWASKVIEAYKEQSGVIDGKLKEVEIKLANLKREFLKNNREYNPNEKWIENAKREHSRQSFRAVITAKPPSITSPSEFIFVDDAHAGNSFWSVPRAIPLNRRARDMAKCVSPLFQISRRVSLVDPYFNPEQPRFINPLKAFVKEIHCVNPQISKLEYHLCHNNRLSIKDFKSNCERNRQGELLNNFEFHFFIWEERHFHARYVLTDVGGISFENGLQTSAKKTDVHLLDPQVYRKAWDEFQIANYQNELEKPFEEIIIKRRLF